MIINWYENGVEKPYQLEPSLMHSNKVTEANQIEKESDDQTPSTYSPIRKNIEKVYGENDSKQQISRQKVVTADQIMSKDVICLNGHKTISLAWSIFKTKKIRHSPIINDEGNLIGIISDKNLLLSPDQIKGIVIEDFLNKSLIQIMKYPVLTAKASTDIHLLTRIMFREKLGSIPIVDDNGKVIGILTRSDILKTVMTPSSVELWT